MKAKHCMLGHVLGVLLVLCGSLFLGCTNENDLSGDQNDGTDPGRIATLEDQAASIEASIRDLEEVYEKHEELIEKLSTEVSGLEDLLDALESSGAYEDPTETQAYKELEERYSSLQNAKSLLSEKIDSLEAVISKLQNYVDDELATKDWAEATSRTLAQYGETLEELLSIKGNLETIDALVKKNEGDISDINESIVTLETAIEDAKKSMEDWVNETLAGRYYDIATIEIKLKDLETKLSGVDATLAEDLADHINAQQAALEAALEGAKEELTKAYEQAISAAIEYNNGVIDGKIAKAIETANKYVDTEIGKINEEIVKLDERITAMEETVKDHGERIQTVEEQIDSIKVSIGELEDVRSYLEDFKTTLESEADGLREQLKDNTEADYETKKALEDSIQFIESQIDTLKVKDEALDKQIAALQNYVDDELADTKDWTEATSRTLEQYGKTLEELLLIQKELEYIKTFVEENEGINDRIYALESAIEDAENSMKPWVNEKIANLENKVVELEVSTENMKKEYEKLQNEIDEICEDLSNSDLESQSEALDKLNSVQTALQEKQTELDEKVKDIENLISDYNAEVDDVITQAVLNEGRLDNVVTVLAEIKAKVSEHERSVTVFRYEIDTLASEVGAIQSEIQELRSKIESILGMVQSVVYMPEYSDGAAYVGIFSRTLEMSFKLSPSSVVASLKEVWESSLSVKFLTTKSTKAAPVMKDLSIKSAEFDETIGTVTVTVDCSNLAQSFYTGETSASASLFIYDGHNNVSSDFVPLVLNEDETIDLPSLEAANCYIVSESGKYQFKATKGNSSELLPEVAYAEVLWESFGTDVIPEDGDLVSAALYRDGNIYFKTADTFKEGNAVIAAKDASGKILWSWHIWLTDQPKEQVYYNNAGTMMDRNLGATSATPGDVGALGLLYQWGRKDPFLGSSSISRNIEAKSTIVWPSVVSTSFSVGTVDYVTSHPTTYVLAPDSPHDWHYSSRDNSLWTTSEVAKSIYDPCPSGWRVPDGGDNGIWSKAGFIDTTYDGTNEGISFSISSPSTTWYPASGYRNYDDGSLSWVGNDGGYWSASPDSDSAYSLYFSYDGIVSPVYGYCANGGSVRCIKEGTGGGSSDSGDSSISTSSAVSLTTTGTSNSYIVSQKGTYSFPTVKGNSSASVGSVESAEVLWESFGTDVTPEEGDLVSAALYRDGNIYFKTADTFKEGNAVIAAKDASGTILWSWHIWLTDQPEEQVYYNNAGTMMDRNLGATSATPGDVGALGLLYQWGRKDPFLGSSSISSITLAKSTITWPSAVVSSSATGTVDYAILNPTTFVTGSPSCLYDWHYASRDNTLWTTSDKTKSIYDPCPAGWRVPDGGSNGIWSKAGFIDTTYDGPNEGISFSISSPSTTWYPASGRRDCESCGLLDVGDYGRYWSASPLGFFAYGMYFNAYGSVSPLDKSNRASGNSVRCIKEGTGGGSSDSDSNVQKETVRFESVTCDWTLQRALDLRGDNDKPYAKPIINNVRYDNIDNLERFLRPDSEYQITKTVKCGDQIVDPSVITIQNISPLTAGRQGSADIVLSGYEFGDTENTYSFEILASNDDLELIITGSITLGALPETVEIEREVDLMLVLGTTQFEGVEALVADAYEELGVENAGFNEANLAKVNDVMLAVLNDSDNVVTNVPNYRTNLNFQVDANVDNSFVRLYNNQVANNILNPDGYVFKRTIDTWFGVDFVYTITAMFYLPANYLIPSEDFMATDENGVNYVEVSGKIKPEGVYTIDLADLGKYFNVAGEIENKLKVKFDILRGDVRLSPKEVEVNALGELDNNKAVVDWDQYAGTVVDVKASLLAENTYILDEFDFQLRTKDPLTFEFGDIVRVTRVPGMSATAKVYENVVLTSSVEPSWANLVNQNASSLEDVFAESKADITYGLEVECDLLTIYTYDSQGSMELFPQALYGWDRKSGVLTLFENPTGRIVCAEIMVSFEHKFHDNANCEISKTIMVQFIPS